MRLRWVILIAAAIVIVLMVVDYAHGQTIAATKIRFSSIPMPISVPANAFELFIDSADGQLKCRTISLASCLTAGGGGGTPGGSNTQVQFNDSSAFGGDSGLTYNKTTDVLTAVGGFVGALTGNASTSTALAANPADCGSNQYAIAIAASGNLSCQAVPFSDLTGSATDAQIPNTITIDLAAAATALAADGTNCSAGNYPLGVDASGNVQTCTAASGGGTVTSFSAGDLSPLFTTTEATVTTTPALSFGLTNAAANTVFANCTGSLGAPSYCTLTDAMVPDSITISLAAAATALAANPADCAANQFAQTIAASGALGCAAIADADVPNNITISLAAAATALAANGTNCASTEAAIGVDASGNAEGCWTPGAGGGAVASGHYLTTVADANTNEVVVTPGEGMERRINETDSNGGPYTLDFDPNDPSYFWIREEFCGGLTTTGNVGDNGWNLVTIGAAPTITYQALAVPNLCAARMSTTVTTGQGGTLSPALVQTHGNLSANTNWEVTWIFRLNGTVTESFRIGLVAAMNAIEPTGGIWLRYDTNLSDTAFKVETRSASTSTVGGTTYTVDTNFHRIRIRSTTAGQIIFTFDANADQTISTNVPIVAMAPGVVLATRAAAARTVDLDFFAFKMRGLAR